MKKIFLRQLELAKFLPTARNFYIRRIRKILVSRHLGDKNNPHTNIFSTFPNIFLPSVAALKKAKPIWGNGAQEKSLVGNSEILLNMAKIWFAAAWKAIMDSIMALRFPADNFIFRRTKFPFIEIFSKVFCIITLSIIQILYPTFYLYNSNSVPFFPLIHTFVIFHL